MQLSWINTSTMVSKMVQKWKYINSIFPEYLGMYYLFLFSGKPTTKLRNSVDWRSSLIQNSTILKHRSLGKTPQRIKWTWTSCLIFCQKRSLTPQHQVQDQSGQCCQICFFSKSPAQCWKLPKQVASTKNEHYIGLRNHPIFSKISFKFLHVSFKRLV